MLSIYKREMRAYFTGVIGYVFLVLFLAIGGAIFSLTTLFSMTASSSTYFTYMLIFSAVVLPEALIRGLNVAVGCVMIGFGVKNACRR